MNVHRGWTLDYGLHRTSQRAINEIVARGPLAARQSNCYVRADETGTLVMSTRIVRTEL